MKNDSVKFILPLRIYGLIKLMGLPLLMAVLFYLTAIPVYGQSGSFSSVYSDTWTEGSQNWDYDELQPVGDPNVVGCGVGEIDPKSGAAAHSSL